MKNRLGWLAVLTAGLLPFHTLLTSAQVYVPSDVGTAVNGFQDDFNGAALGPNWTPTGTSLGIYSVNNGMLHVTSGSGDPNHLLYTAAGYDNTVQEVLMRIRIVNFGSLVDQPRAGAAVAVEAASSQGISYFFRDFNGQGQTGRHISLLDDKRGWITTALGYPWQNNVWYWMRIRHEPDAPSQGGVNDVFCKIWLADGATPEPANWQLVWDYTPGRTTRAGYAGVAAGSNDGLSEFDVDYILIKASGLPSIVAAPAAFPLDQTPVQITNQPADMVVGELLPVTFTVGLKGYPWPSLQWYRNDVPIAGATNASYSMAYAALADNGAGFMVVAANVASNVSTVVTSRVATLTVNADTVQPTLLGAQSIGVSQVQVLFSERITSSSAMTLSNYVISSTNGGATVYSVILDPSQSNAVLNVSPLMEGTLYTLTVNGLTDPSVAANPIAPNTQITFLATSFARNAIGNPALPGNAIAVVGGYDVSGAGNDIGGTADQFQFTCLQRSGDFDIQVRLESLTRADVWTEAGLMVRETLDAGSRFAAVLATPNISGSYFVTRSATNAAAVASGSSPVAYPNMWLRLQRVGNQFTGYVGYDGQSWTRLGTVNLALTANVYFGFAVSSHNSGQLATGAFRDFSNVVNPLTNTMPAAVEPLGQCSRFTSLVISEIMYKWGYTDDFDTVDFVELFNTLGTPEDISGYRLSGDIEYTFPTNTIIGPGAFLVIARDKSDMWYRYGLGDVLGPYSGTLTPQGRVRLRHRSGAILLEVNYSNKAPWPLSADGAGHSLVLARPSYGENNPLAWAASDSVGGSPGRLDPVNSDPFRAVVINELMAHAGPGIPDWVELYNHGNQALNIGGCSLSDDPVSNKFVIPVGTVIPARGFVYFTDAQLGFGLKAGGDTIYFRNAARTRVLDVVQFKNQALGVSWGRCPDGAPSFSELSAPTPGTNNAAVLQRDIVINEIMYSPISGNDDEQYVELYNRGTTTVSLASWKFVDGIDFAFPSNAVIAPDGYVVVGRSAFTLRYNHPNLNSANSFGDFGGRLSHGGERIALAMPEVSTNASGEVNTNYIVVNEVTYSDAGRWPQWADGGGSSLELIDPRSDNSLAANWADSDESSKSSWSTISATGVADNGSISGDQLQVLLQGAGECLVDSVEVIPAATGINLIANATFDNDAIGWTAEGTEEKSGWEAGGGYTNSACYHVRAVDRGDNQVNRIRTPLSTAITANTTNTIRAQVRWLKGYPEILLRIRGSWLEAFGTMAIPSNLGTPGERNSRAVSNAGPAIYAVTHAPVLPADNQPVVVTARINDPDGGNAVVKYRLDPSPDYSSVAMVDDGTGGDAVAGDGLYSATLPGAPAGTLVAYYIQAMDGNVSPATSRFPDNAPVRECLIRFGEQQPAGNIPVYRMWMTQATFTNWAARNRMNNTPFDVTFVLGNQRVIYNSQALYAGSPYIAPSYTSPTAGRCAYSVTFPGDDLLLGTTDLVLDWPGGHGNENTGMQEQMGYWITEKMGLPYCHRYTIRLHINGVTDTQRSAVFEAVNQPASEFIRAWSADASEGDFFKIDRAFEFNDAGARVADPQPRLENYTTVGGAKKLARYRWNWLKRAGSAPNVYTNIFNLVDAVNQTNAQAYTAQTEALVDVEEWMGIMAAEHIVVNFDAYGHEIGKNMYAYKPEGGKWVLYMFDLDWLMLAAPSHVASYAASSAPLFNSEDPTITRMYGHPPFVRAYYRAVKRAVDNAFNLSVANAVMDAKYTNLVANGVQYCDGSTLAAPTAVKTWFSERRNFLVSQLAGVTPTFAIAGTNYISTNANVITLSGTAPITVKTIQINGIAWPVTWTNVTSWTLSLVLNQITNQFTLQGYDEYNNPVAGTSNQLTVVYEGQLPSLAGTIVFSEIMYNPSTTNLASYVEIMNTSSNFTFDLSGWRINGLGNYTFPGGSFISNRQYLVLAENRGEFANTYGASARVFDEYAGKLELNGETLTLLQPGATANDNTVIDKVRYEPARPWAETANGMGSSLQLIDSAQDNVRVANWSVGATWRYYSFTTNSGTAGGTLYLFPNAAGDLYLDDLRLVFGTNAAAGTNLLRNADFESGTLSPWSLRPGVSASSITNSASHGGNYSLHLLSSGGGNLTFALSQTIQGYVANSNYTLSYWYLAGANVSQVAAQIGDLRVKFIAQNTNLTWTPYTPGAPNSVAATLPAFPPVWLNEVQPQNLNTRTNRFGQFAPWVELYNAGTNQESLAGLYLANNYTSNMLQWAFPQDATIGPGEFKVVWLDGAASNTIPSEWHASFTIAESTGSVALVRVVNAMPQVVDYLNYLGLGPSLSYGDYPDGQPFSRQIFFNVTPEGTNNAEHSAVFINEWVTSNVQNSTNGIPGHADPADGDYDDWFELYNPMPYPVNLDKYFLTDATNLPIQFRIPPGYIIPPHGFLVVWADGEAAQNRSTNRDLHVNFQLSRSGEQIALYDPNTNLVDGVVFGAQTNNISEGRYGDGANAPFYFMANPTPGTPNLYFANIAPTIAAMSDQAIAAGQLLVLTNSATDPNGADQLLTFHLGAGAPLGAVINPVSGVFAWTPGVAQAGTNYEITVWVEDNGLPRLAATNVFHVYVVPGNRAPVIGAIPTQTVTLGETLSFGIMASDPDVPLQILTYSLEAGAPNGASISPGGVFTWTPAPEQVPSTNLLAVRVQDNGTPPLSATNAFTVIALTGTVSPVRLSVSLANGGATVVLSCEVEPARRYKFQSQENLDPNGTWQDVPGYEDVTAPSGVFNIQLPWSSTNRFYRIKVLP